MRDVRKRLAKGRREELLDGVMAVIARDGFSQLRISDLTRELHCSAASLYKIAPSKDSLVVLAIGRWGDRVLEALERETERVSDPAERARLYFQAGARSLADLSGAFRRDVERYESSRVAWRTIPDRFIDRFVQLLEAGVEAGEIREINARFVAHVLRQIGYVTRDQHVLDTVGLTAEQAIMQVDDLLWDGIRARG
jgi:AcrR family transcriptional regulator